MRPARRNQSCAVLIAVLAALSAARPTPAADVLMREDFSGTGPSGLPSHWSVGPPAHAPYVATSADTAVYGLAPPSLLVALPPHTLNYRVSSRAVEVPGTATDLTLEVSLRLEMPDSPFLVEARFWDAAGDPIGEEQLLDLPGENTDSFRRYRVSFPNLAAGAGGECALHFGLSYYKTFREGRFRIDDLELRAGRETGPLEVYLTPASVDAGRPVDLHISAGSDTATVRVYREEDARIPAFPPLRVTGLSVQPVPAEVWRAGCGWPVSASIATGADWPSGVYSVVVDDGNRTACGWFVVRGRGGDGRVLVVLPNHTWQAYNGWGGESFYSAQPSPEVSFERPYAYSLLGPYAGPILLLRWLSRERIPFAAATDDDLNDRPDLLYGYPGLILCHHTEYWTRPMRRAVENYFDAGGSVLSLAGNTCWWQTRLETDGAGGRRLVCYKYNAAQDPIRPLDPSLVTTRWDEPPLNDPADRLFGLSWRHGGMVNWSSSSDCPCPYDWLEGHGGYRVFHTDHWALAGTGLAEGDSLGREDAIVGWEVDGAPLGWDRGQPVVRPDEGTPPGFVVLGYAAAWSELRSDSSGVGLMGIIERDRGFLFNAGTIGWCWGLARDPGVQTITRNLIDHLPVSAPPLPSSSPAAVRVIPNPSSGPVTLDVPLYGGGSAWSANPEIQVFRADGGRVAVLAPRWFSPLRARAVWDVRDAEGRPLPPGVYWARVPGASARIVRIR